MSRMSKACDIPKEVKTQVWERDGGRCIFCGSPQAAPNMHYIPRSHGGLGISENIGTGCQHCHNLLDNSQHRRFLLEEFRLYLMRKYPGWDENALIYRKGGNEC